MTETKTAQRRDAGARSARSVAQAWEDRTTLVKNEMAAESAANDAKTARLKALRLARDAGDAGNEKPADRAPRANGKGRARKI